MNYTEFLQSKSRKLEPCGVEPIGINPVLYDFQKAITRWAIRMGRAAVFADCGLGKTFMQLEWARETQQAKGGNILIVAPLCVAEQTINEGRKINLDVEKVAYPTQSPIQITNYEKLQHFKDYQYTGIVLDESSILKSIDGKTRTMILNEFGHIPYRLACTATPAPNDISEIGNHAQFLGVMKREEMLATFFVHDETIWRLKGHAQQEFYKWMASWCVFLRDPEDIGFQANGYNLPKLSIQQHIVTAPEGEPPLGQMFTILESGIRGRQQARRNSISERATLAQELIGSNPGQWLIWCGLNDEGRELSSMLDSCVLIEGNDSEQHKVSGEHDWRAGDTRILISKPSMFGFGMNWQHCSNVIFLGLGDSYEQYYQAIRRTWRFGQQNPVDVHIIVSDIETNVLDNVNRKKAQAETMAREVIESMGDIETAILHEQNGKESPYTTEDAHDNVGQWTMMLGDCTERIKEIESDSIALSVFSPPFAALYTYSDSPRDMGNSKGYDEFFDHYKFMVSELLRVTMPGRRCCTHVAQVVTTKAVHGVIGWRDFRADVVKCMTGNGWIYDGEVVIDKDPQAQAIRTKSKSLLFVQLRKDSSWLRPAMADYILLFRAPGDNLVPIHPDISNEDWISWARPIWYGIRETATLTVAEAREEKDERHIAPLQLGVIERCLKLWSNPKELILSPFAGIGSEGYEAMKHDRRFIGIELKESYYRTAIKNLKKACAPTLFNGGTQ